MVAYFLLSLVTGISLSVGVGPGPFSLSGWVATAFFAWRVTDGGRISRMLLIVLSWAGFIFAVVSARTGLSVAEIGTLVASVAQIALLLSPAVTNGQDRMTAGEAALAYPSATMGCGDSRGRRVLVLTWAVVYAAALSGHEKAGLFHGGGGATAAACAFCPHFAGRADIATHLGGTSLGPPLMARAAMVRAVMRRPLSRLAVKSARPGR